MCASYAQPYRHPMNTYSRPPQGYPFSHYPGPHTCQGFWSVSTRCNSSVPSFHLRQSPHLPTPSSTRTVPPLPSRLDICHPQGCRERGRWDKQGLWTLPRHIIKTNPLAHFLGLRLVTSISLKLAVLQHTQQIDLQAGSCCRLSQATLVCYKTFTRLLLEVSVSGRRLSSASAFCLSVCFPEGKTGYHQTKAAAVQVFPNSLSFLPPPSLELTLIN